MAKPVQYSLAGLLVVVTLAAMLFAAMTWLPDDFRKDTPLLAWVALANELFLVAISLVVLSVASKLLPLTFSTGFAAFSCANLLFGLSNVALLHTLVLIAGVVRLGGGDDLDFDLICFATPAAACLWGLVGGTYAHWRAWRSCKRPDV